MSDKCKGCGAEIVWAVTDGGRHIPLDAKAEKRFILVEGAIQPPAALLRDTYVTHFATCPKAGEFRKR
jgi:hypothetical protein